MKIYENKFQLPYDNNGEIFIVFEFMNKMRILKKK